MFAKEDCWMIQELHHQGVYQGEIVDRPGVHGNTVRCALKRSGAPSRTRRHERVNPGMERQGDDCESVADRKTLW